MSESTIDNPLSEIKNNENNDINDNNNIINEEQISVEDNDEMDEIENIESTELPKRNIKDVILGNQLPPRLLIFALCIFVLSFQIFIIIASILIEKYYSILFSLCFLIIPCFWAYFFYFSRRYLRETAPVQRVLQSIMLGYFADIIVYLGQWIIVYVLIYIMKEIYILTDKNQLILLCMSVWETIFEAIFLEAVPEEILKYLIVYHISSLEALPSKYGTVVYCIVGSLGFIFFSGSLRILRVYWLTGITHGIVYFFVESLLTSSMQILTGLWIGLLFVKKVFRHPRKYPIPTWRVILPSIIFHSVFMSLISVIYLLYYGNVLNWQIFILACSLLALSLIIGFSLSIKQIKALFSDPNFYALLTEDGEPADDYDLDKLDDNDENI